MKFGLFSLMPQRELSTGVRQIYDETIALVRQAEALDFDIAWFAEHHFSNYCMCPSPMVMAAHCAAVTKKIRLGAAVLVLPLYSPVRMVEEIGMLDVLSNGRSVIGIGAGYQDYEFARFNVSLAENWERSHELLDIIELGLTRPSFSYDGKHYKLPELPVAVRPLQSPRPDIFVAGGEPRMLERVARQNYVSFATVGYGHVDLLVKIRQNIAANFRAAGCDPESMRLAVQRYVYVTNDRKDALDAAERILYTARVAASLRGKYEVLNGTILEPIPFKDEPTLEQIVDNVIIGDAETCAEKLVGQIRLLQPVHWSCFMQFGGLDGRRALRSMERFGAEVLPRVRRELPGLEQIGVTAAAAAQ
jgi:alkanesulfonate monooxygenase SsuD/methylene tetrahydromethanopterin reductase-like flavin-dependent oxidoreductase (luciferase family)